MSSANFFTGYSNDKPSSKVINPPGGRSNNIFGSNHEENQNSNANNKARNQTSSVFFGDDSTPAQQPQRPNEAANNRQKSSIFGDDPAKENNSKDRRTGYNPITGKSYEIEQPAAAVPAPAPVVQTAPAVQTSAQIPEEEGKGKGFHPSSRVLQPPGGKSHGLW